jgi:hypothetical protein
MMVVSEMGRTRGRRKPASREETKRRESERAKQGVGDERGQTEKKKKAIPRMRG